MIDYATGERQIWLQIMQRNVDRYEWWQAKNAPRADCERCGSLAQYEWPCDTCDECLEKLEEMT